MPETEKTLLATADRMLLRFGDGALREVEIRIAELDAHGERDAARYWRKVLQLMHYLHDHRGRERKH